MKPRDFCFWLQGFAEIGKINAPRDEDWEIICEHLALPTVADPSLAEGQFVIWLRGFVEVAQTTPEPHQWDYIVKRLQELFTKVTGDSDEARERLDDLIDAGSITVEPQPLWPSGGVIPNILPDGLDTKVYC